MAVGLAAVCGGLVWSVAGVRWMRRYRGSRARVNGIDPLIHPPARLRLMAMLSAVTEAEFATLRDRLEVSDSVLSKHIGTLAAASYVSSRKGSHLGRRTTWVAITPGGSDALACHAAGLREVIAGVRASQPAVRGG